MMLAFVCFCEITWKVIKVAKTWNANKCHCLQMFDIVRLFLCNALYESGTVGLFTVQPEKSQETTTGCCILMQATCPCPASHWLSQTRAIQTTPKLLNLHRFFQVGTFSTKMETSASRSHKDMVLASLLGDRYVTLHDLLCVCLEVKRWTTGMHCRIPWSHTQAACHDTVWHQENKQRRKEIFKHVGGTGLFYAVRAGSCPNYQA